MTQTPKEALLEKLDTTFKQLVADDTPPTADAIQHADDICSGLEVWVVDQTEQLAKKHGKRLWADDMQARKLDAVRSRS